MLVKLKLPPGVYRNGTAYQNTGRYFDANLVRWYEGTVRPIGGWVKATLDTFDGKARGLFAWRQNDGERRAAIGTHTNLYIYGGGALHDITPAGFTAGREDSIPGIGYGSGPYGGGDYGESSGGGTNILDAATWSFDSWGESLVACCLGDGIIYEWTNDLETEAAVIANAPEDCVGVVVTAERNLVALGAEGVGRRVSWSDTEDNTTWTPTATNSAGSFDLQTDGRLKCGVRTRGITLLLTESDAHIMEFVGKPFVYRFERVATACGIFGPKAIVAFEGGAAWMGHNSFFRYDGSVAQIPCDVSDYVFSDINRTQSAKVYAGHNARFSEAWWFYCSAGSTEIDRYVSWNYRENHWSIGSLARTSWVDAGVFNTPLATGTDGLLYEHENGWTNDGAALTTTRFAQSGPVEIDAGDRTVDVTQTLPDEKTQGQIRLRFTARFTPEGSEYTFGPYTVSPYMDTRFMGRQVSVKIEGTADDDWRLGDLRLDVRPGGRR